MVKQAESKAKKQFKALDANGDGQLDATEQKAPKKKKK
jgi:hypothetical protein